MAASFTREQVLEQIFNDEASEQEDEMLEGDEDSEKERLREFLGKYKSDKKGFDLEFFVKKAVDSILPIIDQSTSETRSDGKIYFPLSSRSSNIP